MVTTISVGLLAVVGLVFLVGLLVGEQRNRRRIVRQGRDLADARRETAVVAEALRVLRERGR